MAIIMNCIYKALSNGVYSVTVREFMAAAQCRGIKKHHCRSGLQNSDQEIFFIKVELYIALFLSRRKHNFM